MISAGPFARAGAKIDILCEKSLLQHQVINQPNRTQKSGGQANQRRGSIPNLNRFQCICVGQPKIIGNKTCGFQSFYRFQQLNMGISRLQLLFHRLQFAV